MEVGSIQELSTLINMKIDTLVVGSLRENCYIVTIGDNSFIVDPGDEAERIINACKDKNIKEILVTHHHFDHVGALESVKNYYNAKVYDYSTLKEENNIGVFTFRVIPTPGHTDDSISVYFKDDNVMFVGDFVFNGSIGRTDLGGNEIDMKKSIETILSYDDSIRLYPGHYLSTTIGDERKNLEYFSKMF